MSVFRWWQRSTAYRKIEFILGGGDPRFQPDEAEVTAFTPVEIADADIVDTPTSSGTGILHVPHIEITLENGRKLSVSEGVDAGFVLELARGLAA